MARLRVFRRLICPSVWPLLHRSVIAFLTALTSPRNVRNGIAHIDKFEMAGPIVHVTATGNVDLPAKSLQLKVDPRFIAGTIGLGVPIMVQGSWSEPRIYPDVAGILDDPEGVYAKLKAAGKGFFWRYRSCWQERAAAQFSR